MRRCFSTVASHGNAPVSVPGLHVYYNFLRSEQKDALTASSIALHRAIETQTSDARKLKCKTYLSQYHNLTSDESYRIVQIKDGNERTISCQAFEKYGESGHKLTYFIGNQNLPQFLSNHLIPRVLQIPEVTAITHGDPLVWNFTFNSYAATKDQTLAGFDFHKDIESNGEVTMIYSLGVQSQFQIRNPSCITELLAIPLLSNSLVLLTQKARWDYEHRVVPVTVANAPPLILNQTHRVLRLSLVLGFKKVKSHIDSP